MKSGNVAIVGRTNVGKSTLLNALLGEPLAITSALPQTTRDVLLGVLNIDNAQIAFVDTPGLHRPRSELGRRMNATALGALRHCDLVVFMTSLSSKKPTNDVARVAGESDDIDPDDKRLVEALPKDVPCVLLLNKVDLLRNKRRLLPIMGTFQALHPFTQIVPISALTHEGLSDAIKVIVDHLPEKVAAYASDTLTDRPSAFFVREYVREQVMRNTQREVPHAVAVTVDRFVERPNLVEIAATIHVEKDGQKGILVGHGGSMIKQIGTEARQRLQQLLGSKVHLELFVRVTERWKDAPRMLAELGYEADTARSLSHLLPGKPTVHKPRQRAARGMSPKGTSSKGAPSRPSSAKRPSSGKHRTSPRPPLRRGRA